MSMATFHEDQKCSGSRIKPNQIQCIYAACLQDYSVVGNLDDENATETRME